MQARMREIGGSTAVFFFTSPSIDFGFGFFSSINETLSTSRRGASEGFGADDRRGSSQKSPTRVSIASIFELIEARRSFTRRTFSDSS
jgi:hypothetical protein